MEKKKNGLFYQSANDGVEYRKVKNWELVLGLSNKMTATLFYILMAYASMIANQGYGIATVTAGLIITGCRIFDGVSDALIAAVFEKLNPKRGKVRVFMLLGWAITILSTFMLYNWCAHKATGILGFVLFLTSYVIFIIGYTFTNMGTNTAQIVITNDPTQRSMTGFISTLYAYFIPLVSSNIISFIILPHHDDIIDTPMLTEMAALYAVLSLIFTLMACYGLKNVDVAETFMAGAGKKKEKISFKDMWNVLSKNRQVQLYMVAAVSDKLAQQTTSQSVVNTMMAGILIGSYMASTMVSNFTTVVGLVCAFGCGVYISKMGAKSATKIFSWVSIAVAVALIIYCFAIGGPNGMNKLATFGVPVIVYAVLMIIKSGSQMALTVAEGIMRADVVDYECMRSGKYMPSVVVGVNTFIDKMISSFGATIALACISLVGYANSTPQKGDAATWPIFWMTMFLMFGFPILGWLLNIIAMKFYKLDKAEMVNVQKEIAELKKAK